MFSSLPQIQLLCQELQASLISCRLIACPVITFQRFWLIFEKNQQQCALFLCFEPPFVRFHLVHHFPLTQKADLAHPLQSELIGLTLRSAKLLNEDRILELTFFSATKQLHLIGEFFSKHPNYYLTRADGKILFALFPLPRSHYQLPKRLPVQTSLSPTLLNSQEMEQRYACLEKEWKFQRDKNAIQAKLSQQLKLLLRRKKQLEEQWQQCSTWESVQHEAELIKAHFTRLKKGLSCLEVADWLQEQPYMLILNPKYTPQEEMAKRFKRAKKLQVGLSHVEEQMRKTELSLLTCTQHLQTLEGIQTAEDLCRFLPPPSTSNLSSAAKSRSFLPYQEYLSASGMRIWVGKNARSNEHLTFSLANGSDWWLHTQNEPGSHVIIRTLKGKEPDSETILDAMQLALYHSKAKESQEAEICLTQRKYVSRLGKQTGKVQISKHKSIWMRFDPLRYQALKQRKSPEEEN